QEAGSRRQFTSLCCLLLPASCLLFSFELRLTFLRIGVETFLCVFALEELLQELAFEGESFGERQFIAGLHRTLNEADSLARLRRRDELFCVFDYFFVEARFIENLIDESRLLRFVNTEQLAGGEDFHCAALADDARQALRANHAGQ